MLCLDDTAVHAWVRGTLAVEREVVWEHLDQCSLCRELILTIGELDWTGQEVGRYRVLERIGSGAMGEVYRANDPDLHRDVAIKLVRSGGSEQRLLREAQAMAQLAHPHVIRVYDVGTVADKLFLAMELVTGQTLAEWFREDHGWRAVVRVMLQAGRGLAAAHAAGLVHGDFKPSNVLVAGDGRVCVTDFGLARSSDPSSAANGSTASDATGVAGTPAYMAAEQFAGAAATASSDQFGFCAALYEGLYGKRPFAGPDVAALRAAVTAGAPKFPPRPRLPSRLIRALRRGLAPDPAKRFASLTELLAELDRAARRRNRVVAAGAVGVVGLAAALAWAGSARGPHCDLGASEVAGVWNGNVRDQALGAFAGSRLPYALVSFSAATAALDRYAATWTSAYDDTCAATRVRDVQSETLLDLRMECLRRRKQELGALATAFAAADPAIVRGSVDAVGALPPVAACAEVASLQELEHRPADPELRRRVAITEHELASCRAMLDSGRYHEAAGCVHGMTVIARDFHYDPLDAEAELLEGQATTRLRDWDRAEAALTRALLAAETGHDSRTRAQALTWLVAVSAERSTFAEGHQHLDQAAALVKGLDDDPDLTASLALNQGLLLMRESKLDAATEALGRAIALREKLSGPNDARVAEPLGVLATVQLMRKQYPEARATIDRTLAIQRATLGDSHPAIGKTLNTLAQLQMRTGDLEGALATQRRSYDLLVAAYGEAHRDVVVSLGTGAAAYMFSGKYAEAEPFARRSAEQMEKVAGPDSPDTATALQTYSAVLSRLGKPDEALELDRRVLAIREKALGPEHLLTTQAEVNLAMALRLKSRCSDALPLLDAALAARTKQLPANHPDILRVLQTTADCQVDLGHASDAVATFERVVAGVNATPRRSADDHVTHAMAEYGLARALWDSHGSHARATSLARDAKTELDALEDKRAADVATWASHRHVAL
jgi:tetratricopeptide (TPR) repeat protein/predicted Ser/Thr protein kinase